jgi:hypothetical protein
VNDIWRGYVTQRLLWEIGGSIAFLPPIVKGVEVVRHLKNEFEDEQKLYNLGGKLVDFLRRWNTSAEVWQLLFSKFLKTLFHKMQILSQEIRNIGFWEEEDVHLIEAWITDLTKIGYNPPPLSDAWKMAIPSEDWLQTIPSNCNQKVFLPLPSEDPLTNSEFEQLLQRYKTRLEKTISGEWEPRYVYQRTSKLVTVFCIYCYKVGGLGNRLPPLISGFALALLTDRLLAISWIPGSILMLIFLSKIETPPSEEYYESLFQVTLLFLLMERGYSNQHHFFWKTWKVVRKSQVWI